MLRAVSSATRWGSHVSPPWVYMAQVDTRLVLAVVVAWPWLGVPPRGPELGGLGTQSLRWPWAHTPVARVSLGHCLWEQHSPAWCAVFFQGSSERVNTNRNCKKMYHWVSSGQKSILCSIKHPEKVTGGTPTVCPWLGLHHKSLFWGRVHCPWNLISPEFTFHSCSNVCSHVLWLLAKAVSTFTFVITKASFTPLSSAPFVTQPFNPLSHLLGNGF